MNSSSLVLLIFLIILAVLFAVFSLLFFIQNYYLKQERKIKNNWNEISSYFEWYSFEYLESLSKNNEQLKSLTNRLIKARAFYLSQVKLIKTKIIKLTAFNRKFNFHYSAIYIKQIKEDINNCKQLYHLIKDVYSSATDYNQFVSNLIFKYRVCYDEINTFYKKNLSARYQDVTFDNFQNQISNLLIDISNDSIKINDEKVITNFSELDKQTSLFYQFVKLIYIYTQVYYYLMRCSIELSKLTNNNVNVLTPKEASNIQKIQVESDSLLKDLGKALNALNLVHSKKLILLLCLKIKPALNIFKNNESINLLIQKSTKLLSNSIALWENNLPSLTNAFNLVKDYFDQYEQDELSKKINDVNSFFKKNKIRLETIIQDQHQLQYLDRIAHLNLINEALDDTDNWIQNLTKFCDEIYDKYKNSVNLINQIYELKWTAEQLQVYQQLLNPYDEITKKNISLAISSIDQLIKAIKEDYLHNYAYAKNLITDIENNINSLYNSFISSKSLQIFAKNLLFFANKYRHEDKEIEQTINHCEELYQQKKYKDSLDSLIITLNKIKESAKISHVRFS